MNAVEKNFASLVVGIIVGMALVFVLSITKPPAPEKLDYQAICEERTVAWSGLRACYEGDGCYLGDAMLYDMYRLNKQLTMSCAMYNTEKMILQLRRTEQRLKEDFNAAN